MLDFLYKRPLRKLYLWVGFVFCCASSTTSSSYRQRWHRHLLFRLLNAIHCPSSQLFVTCWTLKSALKLGMLWLSAFLRVVSGCVFFLKKKTKHSFNVRWIFNIFLILQTVFLWYCYTGSAVVKNKQTKQSYSTCSSCLNIDNASTLSHIETGLVFFFFFSSGRTRQWCIKMFLTSRTPILFLLSYSFWFGVKE